MRRVRRPSRRSTTPPLESMISGSGRPALARALGQPRQVAAQQRGDGRVHDRRRAALVLAEHCGRLVRRRHMHVRHAGAARQRPAHARDGESPRAGRLRPRRRQALPAARAAGPHRAGAAPRRGRSAQAPRCAARAARAAAGGGAQPVQLGPRLATELLEVREALGGDQCRACRAPLEQRVRSDGHAMHEARDLVCLDVAEGVRDRRHHALGLIARRGRRLARQHAAVAHDRGIGERAADVDPEDHMADATGVSESARARRPARGHRGGSRRRRACGCTRARPGCRSTSPRTCRGSRPLRRARASAP